MTARPRKSAASRGAATVETTLGILVLIPVIFYGIHFTELIVASTKVTEATAAPIWDATAYPMHITGVPSSYEYFKTLSITKPAESATIRYRLAMDGRFRAWTDAITRATATGTIGAGFTELFTIAGETEVRCAPSDAVTGAPELEYSPTLVGRVIPDTRGMACQGQAFARNVMPRSFYDVESGGLFNEPLNRYDASLIRLCPIGYPAGIGGPCIGSFSMLTDDWGLASAKYPTTGSSEADDCTITLGTPMGVLPCENVSYYSVALGMWSFVTLPLNPVEGALNSIPGFSSIPGASILASSFKYGPHHTLVAATVGTTPSLMATDTAFYMSYRSMKPTGHRTFTPSSDLGLGFLPNDLMLWETTPFSTPLPAEYAASYGVRSGCYLGLDGC